METVTWGWGTSLQEPLADEPQDRTDLLSLSTCGTPSGCHSLGWSHRSVWLTCAQPGAFLRPPSFRPPWPCLVPTDPPSCGGYPALQGPGLSYLPFPPGRLEKWPLVWVEPSLTCQYKTFLQGKSSKITFLGPLVSRP